MKQNLVLTQTKCKKKKKKTSALAFFPCSQNTKKFVLLGEKIFVRYLHLINFFCWWFQFQSRWSYCQTQHGPQTHANVIYAHAAFDQGLFLPGPGLLCLVWFDSYFSRSKVVPSNFQQEWASGYLGVWTAKILQNQLYPLTSKPIALAAKYK